VRRDHVSGRQRQDLNDALEAKFRFLPLITNAIEWTLETDGEDAALTLFERPARPPLAPVAEYLLGSRNVFLGRFGPPSWQLRHVSFRHSAPEHLDAYREVFGVTPQFDAALDRPVFDKALLNSPMRNRDDALSELLRRYAEPALASAERPASVSGRVEALLSGGIAPGVANVARQLGLSPRTLQRMLRNEGTSYAEIANRVLRAAAERLLRRRELAIAEVAHALGFGDSSAFHHAFVRWTQVTPSEFRTRALGESFHQPSHGRLGHRAAEQ
jgi:AraC-like DNA-binding protein